MHALHPPVSARAGGEPLDVERRRRNIEPRVERAAVGVFGFVDHVKKGPDAFETRLARIGPVAFDPVDRLGGGVDAGFDAAVALLDRGLGDELCFGAVSK